jgi:predicted O-linked N-acetylglucosamine transferase (SPINDLY family)
VGLRHSLQGARVSVKYQRIAAIADGVEAPPSLFRCRLGAARLIDYLITDPIVTPPEFASAFTEQFVTLPSSYLIAEPEPVAPSVKVRRSALGLPDDGFVYCSFNSAYKIDPGLFDIWMRILSAVPGSVLWLYSTGRVVEENLSREARARGVAPERLVFAPLVPRPEHVRRHQAADLFLDGLLYNAAATASLSLQSGLPVLTCLGDTFASRVGASLPTAVGLPELIARDKVNYERIAIELARNPEDLRQLRGRLAATMKNSPLFDTPRFVHNLESAYQEMWDNHAAGHSPRPIKVIDDFDQSKAHPLGRVDNSWVNLRRLGNQLGGILEPFVLVIILS